MIINHTYTMKCFKKNPQKFEGFYNAPVPGLEPGTRGLTVHCSNQLSYTGKIFFFRVRNLYKVYNIKKIFSIYLKNQIQV